MYRVIKASNYNKPYDTELQYNQYASFNDLVYSEFTALDDNSKDRYVKGADTALRRYGLDAYSYTSLSFDSGSESLDIVVGNGKAVIVDVDWDAVNSEEWFAHGTDKVVVEDVKSLLRDEYSDESNKEFKAVLSVVQRFM